MNFNTRIKYVFCCSYKNIHSNFNSPYKVYVRFLHEHCIYYVCYFDGRYQKPITTQQPSVTQSAFAPVQSPITTSDVGTCR